MSHHKSYIDFGDQTVGIQININILGKYKMGHVGGYWGGMALGGSSLREKTTLCTPKLMTIKSN